MAILVSVILPYYNGKDFIAETLESIMNQSYPHFEVIIINDGSPSKEHVSVLERLIEGSNDPRIRYFSRPNVGLSEARNFGVANSSGELVAFIDQDDLWERSKLEKQVAIFQKYIDVQLVTTDASTIGDKHASMAIGRNWRISPGIVTDTYTKMLRGNFVVCSAAVFRKSLVSSVGGSSRQYVSCPDYDFFIRCAEVTDFYFIQEPLVFYRLHASNTTKNLLWLYTEELRVIFTRSLNNPRQRVAVSIQFMRIVRDIVSLWYGKITRRTVVAAN